jgi:hypothetical protein
MAPSNPREEAVVTRRRCSVVLALAAAVGLPVVAAGQAAKPAPPAQAVKSPAPETAQPLPRAETRDRNLRAYVELLRSDLRTQKVAVITEVMQFSDAEDAAFWPIYREYERELASLNDERLRGIETYAKVYQNITAATANDLMTKALDLESRRTALKQKYFTKLKSAMSPLTAARALQIENQIQLLLDLQIAASLPVVE